jgi:beta-lactam-binding protein with PASTA domain
MATKQNYFLTKRTFFINVIILIALLITGFFILTAWLNHFTHHGETIPVPDIRGQKISKLDGILAEHHFHYKIVDSLYDGARPPGVVIDQDPAPKSMVKENRTIYLTINSTQPPDVKMPDLVDVSFRQAESILQSYGLVTGEVTYRSDLAKNAVLEQLYKNEKIKAGTMIPKGSMIDLVLGDGLGGNETMIPDLTGLTKSEAWSLLKRSSLNIGLTTYDTGTKDTTNAKIYRQYPAADEGSTLNPGDNVDIYLR